MVILLITLTMKFQNLMNELIVTDDKVKALNLLNEGLFVQKYLQKV